MLPQAATIAAVPFGEGRGSPVETSAAGRSADRVAGVQWTPREAKQRPRLRVASGDLCRRQKQRPRRQPRPGSRERQARRQCAQRTDGRGSGGGGKQFAAQGKELFYPCRGRPVWRPEQQTVCIVATVRFHLPYEAMYFTDRFLQGVSGRHTGRPLRDTELTFHFLQQNTAPALRRVLCRCAGFLPAVFRWLSLFAACFPKSALPSGTARSALR